MATFTIEYGEVLNAIGEEMLGLDTYPIFDESHRGVLNQKILNRYRFREIGLESITLFAHFFKTHLLEVMPYFNKLYESELLKFDPLINQKMTNKVSGESTTKTNSSSETKSSTNSFEKSRSVSSTTPQTMLSESGDYATAATDTAGSGETQASGSDSSTVAGDSRQASETVSEGYSGSAAALLNEYRSALLNIDLAVIESLNPLFMQLWDTQDEYRINGGYYYV